jgi:hypothetical protein
MAMLPITGPAAPPFASGIGIASMSNPHTNLVSGGENIHIEARLSGTVHGLDLVARQLHRDRARDVRALEIPHRRAPEVVEQRYAIVAESDLRAAGTKLATTL